MRLVRKRGVAKWLITLSATLNVVLIGGILFVLSASGGMKMLLYEAVAERIGRTEIAMIGDSITQGGGIWCFRLDRPFGSVRNFGHSGLYVEQMKYQAELAVASGVKDVFVMGGINDAGREGYSQVYCFAEYSDMVDFL